MLGRLLRFFGGNRNADGVRNTENGGQRTDGRGVHRFASARERTVSDCRRIRVLTQALSAQRGGAADRSEGDQVRILIAAASSCGLLVSPERIAGFGDLVSKRTGESAVYWNRAESAFYKVKNPRAKAPIKRTSPLDWLYEHVIHNILFPESAYDFVGILAESGELRVVLKQQAVKTESFPSEEQVSDALASRGLIQEDRYFFGDGVVSVTDVGAHGDNVLLDDAGQVRFVDPLIRLNKSAEDVIERLTGYDSRTDRVVNGFTLIELLVICAILATMVGIGVGSIMSGQGMARVKGATRDVYAAIRHARSTALVTGQRVLVNYSNETIDDEPAVKIEVVAAKIMSADGERPQATPYYVKDYKELPQSNRAQKGQELVHIRGSDAKAFASEGESGNVSSADGGETLEEILFSPMDASVVKGMRILVKKNDEALSDETAEQTRSRISVFSNVDYLLNRYKEAKSDAAAKGEGKGEGEFSSAKATETKGSVNDMNEEVSVVWETNGAVEPHKIWIYPDGKKPEDGLMLNIDSFGAVKVLDGDGREED